jgi:hypothetical protein
VSTPPSLPALSAASSPAPTPEPHSRDDAADECSLELNSDVTGDCAQSRAASPDRAAHAVGATATSDDGREAGATSAPQRAGGGPDNNDDDGGGTAANHARRASNHGIQATDDGNNPDISTTSNTNTNTDNNTDNNNTTNNNAADTSFGSVISAYSQGSGRAPSETLGELTPAEQRRLVEELEAALIDVQRANDTRERQMAQQVREWSARIAGLERDLGLAQDAVDTLRAERHTAEQGVADELSDAVRTIEGLNADLDASRARIASLTADLDASAIRITVLTADLDTAHEDQDALRESVADLSARLESAERDVRHEVETELLASAQREERLSKERDTARTQLAEERRAAKIRVAEAREAARAEAEQRAEKRAAMLADQRAEQHRAALRDLESELAEAREVAAQHTADAALLLERVGSLGTTVEARDTELEETYARCSQLRSELEEALARGRAAETQLAASVKVDSTELDGAQIHALVSALRTLHAEAAADAGTVTTHADLARARVIGRRTTENGTDDDSTTSDDDSTTSDNGGVVADVSSSSSSSSSSKVMGPASASVEPSALGRKIGALATPLPQPLQAELASLAEAVTRLAALSAKAGLVGHIVVTPQMAGGDDDDAVDPEIAERERKRQLWDRQLAAMAAGSEAPESVVPPALKDPGAREIDSAAEQLARIEQALTASRAESAAKTRTIESLQSDLAAHEATIAAHSEEMRSLKLDMAKFKGRGKRGGR